ncbi:phage holin, lambda family [Pantoea agglomerans]|uniref:phage holin, lambda family n=1 Tax=Enterobacter agglomerans TaxID=549 RepID=UPI0038502E1F
MAGQLHIKWMSESLAASPAGGAFLLDYPLKGMSKRLSLVGDREITPVADGQGSYRYCVRVPIQRGRQRAAFFRFCARQSVSTHTFDAVALRNFLLTTDSTCQLTEVRMKRMPDKDVGFWASLIAWLYAHKNETGYAGLAGVMAILRATYVGKDAWSRRLLDAAMCSVFAFFLQPSLQVIGSVFNWHFSEDITRVAAVFLGFLGVDYVSTKIRRQIDKRLGDSNADSQ